MGHPNISAWLKKIFATTTKKKKHNWCSLSIDGKDTMQEGNLLKMKTTTFWIWQMKVENHYFHILNCGLFSVLWCASTERLKDCLLFSDAHLCPLQLCLLFNEIQLHIKLFPKWWWHARRLLLTQQRLNAWPYEPI